MDDGNVTVLPQNKRQNAEIDEFNRLTRVLDSWVPEETLSLQKNPQWVMPHEWVFVDVRAGERVPHWVQDGMVQERVIQDLEADISKFCFTFELGQSERHWSAHKIASAARYVMYNSRRVIKIDDIATVRWRSERGLCWYRMPWDRYEMPWDGCWDALQYLCPVFWEFLGRFTDVEQRMAYAAFLGSIVLDRDNLTHRGAILYGEGRNGKSAQLRLLDHVFGAAMLYKPCGVKNSGSSFKNDGVERARVLAFPDVNDRFLFTDADTKSLVGGDAIEVNRKYGAQFQCRPRVKIIACTNVTPNIRDSIAETRRWIFCDIDGFEGADDPHYQAGLNAEAEVLFGICCTIYEHHRAGSDIIVSKTALDPVTEMAGAPEAHFCERYFEACPGATLLNKTVYAIKESTGTKLSMDRIVKQLRKTFQVSRYKNNGVKGVRGIGLTLAGRQALNLNFVQDTHSGDE